MNNSVYLMPIHQYKRNSNKKLVLPLLKTQHFFVNTYYLWFKVKVTGVIENCYEFIVKIIIFWFVLNIILINFFLITLSTYIPYLMHLRIMYSFIMFNLWITKITLYISHIYLYYILLYCNLFYSIFKSVTECTKIHLHGKI